MKKRKPTIYTIANAHLDTSWLWLLEQTIDEYLPDTVNRNLALIEKYPEYKFNFEGSYRYELIKEYFPDLYAKMKVAIERGQWNVTGSCYENGDVNIPSPEALIRNILYGNMFFEKEFGVQSNDIFLPDCFGFGKALPSVAAHCGLKGFSTGKLFWGSSVPIPFDVGKWIGLDGKGIFSALMPFSYTTSFGNVRKNKRILGKMEENKRKDLPDFTFAYHGNGDRGGAPYKGSARNVALAQRKNKTSDTDVLSASPTEFFDMVAALPQEEKDSLPVYDGEFLLTAHGAGSYTSRTVTKRWNRRCELLADAAERMASSAFINGLAAYPQYALDTAWKQVIAHHFHDDITGTSFEKCYVRNHNDYVQALNTFSTEFTTACKAIVDNMDTSFAKGVAVAVANPVQAIAECRRIVHVKLCDSANNHIVFDRLGNQMPTQTKRISENECEVSFIADLPSCGIAVFDVRESDNSGTTDTQLKVSDGLLENKYLRVQLNSNGEICSIYDKVIEKELLQKPIRHLLLPDVHSFDWPSWEVKYEDVSSAPYAEVVNKTVVIEDNGPVVCSLRIVGTCGKSTFTQLVSLDCESRYVSVWNEIDWREEATLLKTEFCVTAADECANYDIGIGFVRRGINTKSLYEVPAQKWADITNKDETYGVTVFSDSRSGWDKPDANTLRLTCVHTPMANYRWECSQHIMDMGINRYSFAVMGHGGNPEEVSMYADAFCMPAHSFITQAHAGKADARYSFMRLNNECVRVLAVKKAQESDRIIIRVAECSGKPAMNVQASFTASVVDVIEVRGDEKAICEVPVEANTLCFDLQKNEIRSFSVLFENKVFSETSECVALPFDSIGITDDAHRSLSSLAGGISIPRELLPDKLLSGGTVYEFANGDKNCIVCKGQTLTFEKAFDSVSFLLTSLRGDKRATFEVNASVQSALVPDCAAPLGHWDLMQQQVTGYIKEVPQSLTLTHTHNHDGNLTAKQFYLFTADIRLNGQCEIKLPNDKDIVIFAAVGKQSSPIFKKGDSHFDTLQKRPFDYEFSSYALSHMKPTVLERFLDCFFDRTFTINAKTGGFYNKVSLAELYFIIRNTKDRLQNQKRVRRLNESRSK